MALTSDQRVDLLSLFSFMATSARALMDEPTVYGPVRLISAMEKTFDLLKEQQDYEDEVLEAIVTELKASTNYSMTDEAAFIASMDKGIVDIITLLKQA